MGSEPMASRRSHPVACDALYLYNAGLEWADVSPAVRWCLQPQRPSRVLIAAGQRIAGGNTAWN